MFVVTVYWLFSVKSEVSAKVEDTGVAMFGTTVIVLVFSF
jgi:hypothetical protein